MSPKRHTAAFLFVLTIAWIPVGKCSNFYFQYNMTEYYQMPPLHQFENYDHCLRSQPGATYCTVKSIIRPNEQSELWKIIEKYSQYQYQYDHNVLLRGVCVPECEKLISSMNGDQLEQFNQKKFNITVRYTYSDWLLPNISYYRQQFGYPINICENVKLQMSHNLTAYSEIEYCSTSETNQRNFDAFDYTFFTILLIVPILAILSTYYDARRTNNNLYFQEKLTNRKQILLSAFSIRRNIHSLVMEPPSSNQLLQDLSFLDGIRTIIMIVVMVVHMYIAQRMNITQNPEVMEMTGTDPIFAVVAGFSPFTVSVFLLISGFLTAVYFVKSTEGKPFSSGYFVLGVVNRFLRLMPIYLLVMLFTVSVADQFNVSPTAYRGVVLSKNACRRKWWINMLFINNYYQKGEYCLIHTWYLAADFQLFVVGLAAMMLIWRYPRMFKPLVALMALLGFVFPALRTYIYKFDGTMYHPTKSYTLRAWYETIYKDYYLVTDTHCSSYFAGLVAGILYHKIRKNPDKFINSKFVTTLRWLLYPIMNALFLPAVAFEHLNLPKPSLWMSAFAGAHRWIFSAGLAFYFLVYIFFGSRFFLGWLRQTRILNAGILRIPGRLTLSFF
ncbi:O-acyltransferase like protein-like, partial [Uranotaenia lowii]|uniref:O-acyltransferase like protein-like n=1 Tax=Uranotaenia lowii TaxID=190385 RepID=UPI002478F518